MALRNVTFSLNGGEKLAIVGKTGAGKSTLLASLYRSFCDYEGEVLIDGTEISQIEL